MKRDPEKMQSDHHRDKLQKSEVLFFYRFKEWVAAHKKRESFFTEKLDLLQEKFHLL